MKTEFQNWLVENANLTLRSPSGSRGSAVDYAYRVGRICREQSIGWDDMLIQIGDVLKLYSAGGDKFGFGKGSHESYLNSLRYFKRYAGEILQNRTSPKSRQKSRFASMLGLIRGQS